MPSYSYIAVDAMGKEKKATIDAENQDKAAARLKKNGLTLISIKEVGMLEKDIKLSFGRKVKPRDLSVFCRQFVSMIEAGVTVIDALGMLEEQTENIRTLALDTLREAGSDYDVAVYFENSYFPMKSYGDVTFPPGEYEAFRIDIGAHDGKNWWCVLYPPLCFVDTSYGVLPDTSKDTLKEICRAVDLPVVAIGGINKSNILQLTGRGMDGFAMVSAIFAAEDIENECKILRSLSRQAVSGK